MDALLGYGSDDGSSSSTTSTTSTTTSPQRDAAPPAKRARTEPKDVPLLLGGGETRAADDGRACEPMPPDGSAAISSAPAPQPARPPPLPSRPSLPSAAELLDGPGLPDLHQLQRRHPPPAAPDRHQGRVRNFQHVEGSFATVVYVPLEPSQALHAPLRRAFAHVRRHLPEAQPLLGQLADADAAGAPAPADAFPPHISLSRTVPIRACQTQSLVAALQEQLAKALGGPAPGQAPAAAGPFRLAGLEAYANDAGTRTFAALELARGGAEVCAMIRAVDVAYGRHGLQVGCRWRGERGGLPCRARARHQLPALTCPQVFYDEPRPHLSFAWALGDERARMQAALRAAAAAAAEGEGEGGDGVPFALRSVLCRVGCRDYVVWGRG
jgi:hypothetical protein